MRILHLLLGTVALACAGWMLVMHTTGENVQRDTVKAARSAVVRLDQEIKVRSATSLSGPQGDIGAAVNGHGWPTTIEAKWFDGAPPINPLVPPNCPWIEVAGADDADLDNPRVRIVLDSRTAGFWYNPALGIVRARVAPTASDKRAIDLYNLVNHTAIDDIVDAQDMADGATDVP